MIADEQLSFGALLSRFRLAAGLTQAALAEQAGLSVRGISDLERGVKTRPRAYTVRHLADALALAGAERTMFEQSALDPGRLARTVQFGAQAPSLPARSRARRAHQTVLGPLLRTIRGHRTFRLGVLGGAVLILLATGLAVITPWPTSRNEARSLAQLVGSWAVAAPSPRTLVAPATVAVGDGIVYVADSGADRIDAFSPSGRLLFSWGTPGSKPGQLLHPQGLTPDGLGHLYVADTGNNQIEKFSLHGRFLGSFGIRGSRPGEFRSPEGVIVSTSTSWIYVADTGNHRVQAFTPAGAPVASWDAGGSQRGTMAQPTSLVATDEGLVMVGDTRAQRVEVLGANGSFLWDEIPIPPPEFDAPSAVARDAAGHQYTLDTGLNTVRKFDAYGHVLATWHARFRSARGLAVDVRGNVYVADTGNQRILKFAPGGAMAAVWNGGTNHSGLTSTPRALAADRSGNLYVSDSRANEIVVLSPSGRILERLRGGRKSGPLSRPFGVAVNSGGQVYVADTGNNRIVRFSHSGMIDAIWAQRGVHPGPFRAPHGLRIDARGHVLVADTLSGRVEELGTTGTYLQIWYPDVTIPRRGSRSFPASFCGGAYPCGRWTGVAVDADGYIYVTDTLHNLVLKLSPLRVVRAKIGSSGSQPGRFHNPEGIAVSSSGTIYVADTGNHRVEIFAPSGTLIGTIRKELDAPADVLVAKSHGATGTLYVADSGSGRVLRYSIAS